MERYDRGYQILSNNFIPPDEIAAFLDLTYTEEQLAQLSETLPDQDTLKQIRDKDMVLVAGPPDAMPLLKIRSIRPDFSSSAWPEEQGNTDLDSVSVGKMEALIWMAFAKKPVENSLNKVWLEQQILIIKPMVISNAPEATWALMIYKAVRGINLLKDIVIRTRSVDSNGRRIVVTASDCLGFDISYASDILRHSGLGIWASWKF